MGSSCVEKRFPRDVAALESLFGFIAEFHSQSHVMDQDAREVELIAEELFTNFVRHNDGKQEIAVQLERIGDTVRIRIKDEDVEEFDPTQAPEPDQSTPIERRRAGGMGIVLVRRLAQDVSYDYHDRTSTVTVVKRLAHG